MSSHLRVVPFVSLLLLLASCGAAQQTVFPITQTRCYRLVYPVNARERFGDLFPTFVSLAPGTDSGSVRSGMKYPPNDRFWVFLVGANWVRDGQRLQLLFSNGFSGVRYVLTPIRPDSLTGDMTFLYDVVDQRPPPAPVVATAIDCRDARLNSPEH